MIGKRSFVTGSRLGLGNVLAKVSELLSKNRFVIKSAERGPFR